MGKEEFKEALFEAVEAVIDHKMNLSGREVVLNYYNNSKADSSLACAVEAIEQYTQDDLPPLEKRGKKLKACLNRLAYEAKIWDRE